MTYRKETTEYGTTIYSAIQPDYDHELQVLIAPNHLVSTVTIRKTPKTDIRTEITREEYAEAFNSATGFFADFLSINP